MVVEMRRSWDQIIEYLEQGATVMQSKWAMWGLVQCHFSRIGQDGRQIDIAQPKGIDGALIALLQ